MYFSIPGPVSKLYHVFNDNNTSLCGAYAILNARDTSKTKIMGTEKWTKGQDCKVCFRKVGLLR